MAAQLNITCTLDMLMWSRDARLVCPYMLSIGLLQAEGRWRHRHCLPHEVRDCVQSLLALTQGVESIVV